jgi:uncharacterized membrane protein HdeD (DUF308 family)
VIGVLQVLAANRLRGEIASEWFLTLGGSISVLFGIVFANPGRGALRSCG